MDLVNHLLPLLVVIIIIGTASAFTTGLAVQDDITEPIRERIWRRFPRKGQRAPVPALDNDGWEQDRGTFLGNVIACYRCFGVWSTACWVALWMVATDAVAHHGAFGVVAVLAAACSVQRAWNAHT